MKNLIRLAGVLGILGLCACASAEKEMAGPLTPVPEDLFTVIDPDDSLLMAAVSDYLKSAHSPLMSQFEFTRVDLNGDGRREGLVMMNTPYGTWCSLYGCTMLVFQAANWSFSPVSEIGPVRGPLKVAAVRTNGWRDLIVRVSGRPNLQTKDVAMRFDGTAYPHHPAFQPPIQYASIAAEGTEIFP